MEPTRIYMGREGCRCGCLGKYTERGDKMFDKRVARFKRMWESYAPVEHDVDPSYLNMSYGVNRVMTVYFD